MSAAPIRLAGVRVVADGRPVLAGVDLVLQAGERLALVGANGAGKTTLLETVVGLRPLAGGDIEAFGEPRRDEAAFRAMRRRVQLLFQDSDDQLFSPTVLDDTMFGPLNLGLARAEARARAEATLARLELDGFGPRMTHRLSGGEKRLVALATVLAMEPDVLLLDEPTNGLDEATAARIVALLASLDQAMIVVSHDRLVLEKIATRAMVLREGRLWPATLHRHPHAHAHDHVHVHAMDIEDAAEGPGHAHGHVD